MILGFTDYATLFDDPPGPDELKICPVGYDDATDNTTAGLQFSMSPGASVSIEFRNENCDITIAAATSAVDDETPLSYVFSIGPWATNPSQFAYTLFVDGSLRSLVVADTFEPTRWPTNFLQFAPPIKLTETSTEMWKGSIYQLAIYNRSLDSTDAAANYAAGIPNSKPFVPSSDESVLEDTPTLIPLAGSDFDNDTITVELTLLTLVEGSATALRYANGTEVAVTSDDLPLDLDADVSGLVYTPPQDFVGAAGSVTYRARDATKTSLDGVITVTVTAVDDAPVATNASGVAVAEVPIALTMTGTDVDAGDGPASVRIATLPAEGGALFLYDEAAENNLGGPIEAPGAVDGLRVVFVSDTLPPGSSGLDVVATDSFTYFVRDADGTESAAAATFSLSIRNNLFVDSLSATTDEDEVGTVTLAFESFVDGAVSVVVESLPATPGSALVRNDTGADLVDDDLPFTVPGNGLSVLYRPAEDLFGDPLDSFTFSAVRDSTGWRSSTATANLTVASVNDPPTVALPTTEGRVTTFELEANQVDTVAFSVALADPDADDTPYRVTVNVDAFGSYISLNPDAVASGNVEFRANDGIEDGLLIFLALREDINHLFTNISLFAASPGEGSVDFVVSDEAPGGVELAFSVPFVVVEDSQALQAKTSSLPTALIYSIYASAGALLLCLVWCCTRCCTHNKKMARKAAEKAAEEMRLKMEAEFEERNRHKSSYSSSSSSDEEEGSDGGEGSDSSEGGDTEKQALTGKKTKKGKRRKGKHHGGEKHASDTAVDVKSVEVEVEVEVQ